MSLRRSSRRFPQSYKDSEYLFLANIDPVLQARVRSQMPKVQHGLRRHDELLDRRPRGESGEGAARAGRAADQRWRGADAGGETNLVLAAEKVLAMGPKTLVVKHGEYGATAFFSDRSFRRSAKRSRPFRAPALPLAEVVDPTGAGDSFAGGFYGYLASQPELTPAVFRTAMFYGGVMGSFAVERFGTERLQDVTREEIDERFKLFREISHLEHAGV